MAIDAYMSFQLPGGGWLSAESQVALASNLPGGEVLMNQPWPFGSANTGSVPNPGPSVFAIEDFKFDIEHTQNVGSSGGAGAGKITFNPFSITRKIDKCSPIFFEMACSGTAFGLVTLGLRKSSGAGAPGGGNASGPIYLRFDFKLVLVKTIAWTYDSGSPKEHLAFEYGGLIVSHSQQNADGSTMTPVQGGWNRVLNEPDASAANISQA